MHHQPDDSRYYIGLMSGTSMDGTDAVLTDLSQHPPATLAHFHAPYPQQTRHLLERLCANEGTPDDMGLADSLVADHFAWCTEQLLTRSGVSHSQVHAIGSHGQTVRHRPDLTPPFTLQLGDPNRIAEQTGITVVADFRRRDLAAGGQGAPLAPAFHAWCFDKAGEDQFVVNIGGMANVTHLPASSNNPVTGFDTGPGNRLLDLWCERHLGTAFDEDGHWAGSGDTAPSLLNAMLSDPYFSAQGPRSTGREYFNAQWLENQLNRQPSLKAADVQRTLLALSVETIAHPIEQLSQGGTVYVCGGGAYNSFLMTQLRQRLAPRAVASTRDLGLAPELVEGTAFAWLAMQRLRSLNGNLPSVTGARAERPLGAVYPGQ